MTWIAALPMYDWPELRTETDGLWSDIRRRFREHGIEAPARLVRRNSDMPPVPGGIRGEDGEIIAPDPATLDPDAFDLAVLWRHPGLLISGTCWGPMELGLQEHVQVIGQSSYDGIAGGAGELYSSAIIARESEGGMDVSAPQNGNALLPFDFLHGKALAFNEQRSMSGYLGLRRDLEAGGESLDMFSRLIETGAHRASILAVARGDADVATIDCKSWMLAQKYETAASGLHVIGWTARRRGLPYICAKGINIPFLI